MSMDGLFINKLAYELNSSIGMGRINKIYQLSKADFLFIVRAGSKNESLYLSLSPSIARLHLTNYNYDKPQTPSGFCMLLRKYLENGLIKKIEAINGDRIIKISIENSNDFGVKVSYYAMIELMGKHANLAIIDQEGIIIDSFKHVSPFEGQQRTFLKGFSYQLPEDGKVNPYDIQSLSNIFESKSVSDSKSLVNSVRGLSPLFADAVLLKTINQPFSMDHMYNQLLNSLIDPSLSIVKGKKKFYWFNIFSDNEVIHYPSLSKLLDELYFDSGQLERTKQVSKNIYQLIKREHEKNKDKLEKLTRELDKAFNAEEYRNKGDLIIANQHLLQKGQNEFEVINYMNGNKESILLDRMLTPIENAQSYYRKYKKIKTSVNHLKTQITITEGEISYFELLLLQIETASLNDLNEIIEELKTNKYLHEKPIKHKKLIPNYDTYITPDEVEILVGKNNLQNEYLTHHLGKYNEMWFHVKDMPGSHVLVRKIEPLNEFEIRAAANLAAYNSKAKESSSVPVDYTLLKYVKKIPGNKGSFVTYSHQKTIYIDPSKELIKLLKYRK